MGKDFISRRLAHKAPERLFKYRPLKGECARDAVRGLLVHHRVYFAKPEEFNDPFECEMEFDFEATLSEKRSRYKGVLQRHGVSQKEAVQRARDFFTEGNADAVSNWEADRAKIVTDGMRTRTGILCVSAVPHDILMWSHYSAGHTGVCVVLAPQQGNEEHRRWWPTFHPVTYKERVPRVSFYTGNKFDWLEGVFTKAKRWEYEHEYRKIETEKDPGNHWLPTGMVKGVILGCRISAPDRAFVMQLVEKADHDVAVYEASVEPGRYAVTISPPL